MFERRIYVYAFDRETGELIESRYLREEHFSVKNICAEAMALDIKCQGKANVWICDGSKEIGDAVKTMNRTRLFEDKVIFRMLIEQYGMAFNVV